MAGPVEPLVVVTDNRALDAALKGGGEHGLALGGVVTNDPVLVVGQRPVLRRIASGTAILPTSWSSAP